MHFEAVLGLAGHQPELLEAGVGAEDVCHLAFGAVSGQPLHIDGVGGLAGHRVERAELIGQRFQVRQSRVEGDVSRRR